MWNIYARFIKTCLVHYVLPEAEIDKKSKSLIKIIIYSIKQVTKH